MLRLNSADSEKVIYTVSTRSPGPAASVAVITLQAWALVGHYSVAVATATSGFNAPAWASSSMTLNRLRYFTAAVRQMTGRGLCAGISRAAPPAATQPYPGLPGLATTGARISSQMQQKAYSSVRQGAYQRRSDPPSWLCAFSQGAITLAGPVATPRCWTSVASGSRNSLFKGETPEGTVLNALCTLTSSRSVCSSCCSTPSRRQTPLHRRGFASEGAARQSGRGRSGVGSGMTDPSHLYSHPTLAKNVKICGTCSASATESEHEHGPTNAKASGAQRDQTQPFEPRSTPAADRSRSNENVGKPHKPLAARGCRWGRAATIGAAPL